MGKKENIEKLMATGDYKLEDLNKMHFKKIEKLVSEIQEEDVEEVVEDKEEVESAKSVIPRRKTAPKMMKRFDDDRIVTIMSVVSGNTFYTSPQTGRGFDLNGIGQFAEVSYSDILILLNRHPRYLKEPFIVIMDEEIAEAHQLNYDNTFFDMADVESYLELDAKTIKETIGQLSKGSRDLLIEHVARLAREEEDISMAKIRAVEEYSGIKLKD